MKLTEQQVKFFKRLNWVNKYIIRGLGNGEIAMVYGANVQIIEKLEQKKNETKKAFENRIERKCVEYENSAKLYLQTAM